MNQLYIPGFLAGLGLFFGYGFVQQHGRKRYAGVERTPTDRVTTGLVKLEGTVRASETVREPLHGDEVVVAHWAVELDADPADPAVADGSTENRFLGGHKRVPFDLVDEAGSVRVDSQGAELQVTNANVEHDTFDADDSRLETLERDVDQERDRYSHVYRDEPALEDHHNENLRYVSRVIRPGDDVLILGTAERGDGDGPLVTGLEGWSVVSNLPAEQIEWPTNETSGQMLFVAVACLVLAAAAFVFLA